MPEENRDALRHNQRRARRPSTQSRLRRSSEERLLAGVLSGIAEFTGQPVLWVRLIFILGALATAGVAAVAYPLLWLLLPGPESVPSDNPL